MAQTRTRLGGEVPDGSTRIVSLHDTDARPIAKGRLGKPVEFGFKAQVADNTDGIVVDHNVEMGNPPDAPMLGAAIGRIKKRFSKAPRAATADRGYGEAKVETELHELGVTHVAIPRKGRPGAARQGVESSRRFRKLVKWRTGSEGRISYLKHSWGWERTMLDGIDGARTWCGWGILAHNATKIAVLIDEREQAHRLRSFAEATTEDLHRTTRTPPASAAPCARLISPRPSPVAPRRRKRPENGVKSDRRGRSEGPWAHAAVTQDSGGTAPDHFFRAK